MDVFGFGRSLFGHQEASRYRYKPSPDSTPFNKNRSHLYPDDNPVKEGTIVRDWEGHIVGKVVKGDVVSGRCSEGYEGDK